MPYGHTLPQVTGPGHILAPDRLEISENRLRHSTATAWSAVGLAAGYLVEVPEDDVLLHPAVQAVMVWCEARKT